MFYYVKESFKTQYGRTPINSEILAAIGHRFIAIVIFLLFDFLFFYPLLPYLAFTLSGLYRHCDWQLLIQKLN